MNANTLPLIYKLVHRCKSYMWHDWVHRKRVGLCLLHLVSHFVTRNSQKEEKVIRFRVISDKFALLQVVKKEPSLVHFLLVRLLQGVHNNMTCSCLLLHHLGTPKKRACIPSLRTSFGKHQQNGTLAPTTGISLLI